MGACSSSDNKAQWNSDSGDPFRFENIQVEEKFGGGSVSVPVPTGIEAEVCRDIAVRQSKGKEKYGMELALNRAGLRERLQHVYEETLAQPSSLN